MSVPSSPVRSKTNKPSKPKSSGKQTTLSFGPQATSSSSTSSSSASSSRPMKRLGALSTFSFAVPDVPQRKRLPPTDASASTQPERPSSSTADKPKPKLKRKVDVIEVSSDDDDIDETIHSRPAASKLNGTTTGKGTASSKGKGKQKETEPSYGDTDDGSDKGLWTDLYAPQTASELAVNKTKVAEVRAWFDEAAPTPDPTRPPSKLQKYRRILALSGPSGVGKTATVRALASELGLEVVEWVEGAEENGIGGDFGAESLVSRFTSFLSRASGPTLSFGSASSRSASRSDSKRKVLLLDDLPNLSHSATREAFQAALLAFATSWSPSSCPLVVVVTDPGDGGRASESWMDHRRGDGWDLRSVLGLELVDGPYTRAISFNPIAPTFLTKAVTRTVGLACPTASTRPPKEAVELIVHSTNGDVRSAINALQFLCRLKIVNSGPSSSKSSAPKTGKGSRGGKGGKTSAGDGLKALMEAVTRREQSLALFHALGRVLYNKRWGDPDDDDAGDRPKLARTIPLPPHLAEHDRRPSKVDVEALFVDAPVDTSLYSLYLHQNYPLFCGDIDDCFASIESLSGSDAMRTDEDLWQSSPVSIAYAFNLTVRGLLAGLPSPVPRRGQKMYKPDWFDHSKKQRANEVNVSDIGGWCAGLGIASSGGGPLTRQVLTSQLIPQLRYLSIPPTYPASLPPLSSLAYLPPSLTRSATSMRTMLALTDAPGEDEDQALFESVDEDGVDGGTGSFYTEREEVVEGKEDGGSDEDEEDVQEFDD